MHSGANPPSPTPTCLATHIPSPGLMSTFWVHILEPYMYIYVHAALQLRNWYQLSTQVTILSSYNENVRITHHCESKGKMPTPCHYGCTAPEFTSASQPSIMNSTPIVNSSCSRFVSNPEDFNGMDEDGEFLFDVPSSQSPSASTKGEFVGEVKELAGIALEELLFAISPIEYNSKGERDKCLPERARKQLRTFYFEKRVEIEQRLEPDDDDTIIVGLPTFKAHHLACPFYIRQKERHLNCLTHADMREIKDLKRHLWTSHRQSSYCPTCHDTFGLSEDWENHVRLRSCTSSDKPRPEGISALQMQRLTQCADSGVSPEIQWLLIWEIVFPGVKLPSLPFLFGEVETVVWMLRDFWSAEGNRIVCGFLTERRLQTAHLQDDEPNVVALGSLVLDHMIDQLVATCRQDGGNERQSSGDLEPLSFWSSFPPIRIVPSHTIASRPS
ncbi:hypothetical protein F4859DRAFT_484727 [Xylaria cf. heliscus]|nr:hypothetical protein F4859DRAFT_484727 [Xylaria cf. heliscus]